MADLELPEGSLLISVLRDGTGFVPGPDTVLEAGDEVLAVLDPGLEEELKAYFGPDGGSRSDRGGRMSDRRVDYLLIGGGIAVRALRGGAAKARRADGSILLVGREPHRRTSARRSRRSTCAARASEEDAFVNAADWYEENGVELLTGASVMSLDVGARTAKLQTKEEVEFGEALIATGARVNILHHLEGARLEGIHYLRVLGNSDAIREEAAGGGARGADRRQLHRQRGGGVADRDGDAGARW